MWLSSRYLHHWQGKSFRNLQICATKQEQISQLEGYGLTGKWPFVTKVFNPLARCHLHHSLPAVHKKNENKKNREYNQQILQVEHGSFTPLVFSCFGGMSRECSRFCSHTAERLANRRKEPKSKISAWIKTRLNFALIRSMLLCLRGTKTHSNLDNISKIDLCAIAAESNIE